MTIEAGIFTVEELQAFVEQAFYEVHGPALSNEENAHLREDSAQRIESLQNELANLKPNRHKSELCEDEKRLIEGDDDRGPAQYICKSEVRHLKENSFNISMVASNSNEEEEEKKEEKPTAEIMRQVDKDGKYVSRNSRFNISNAEENKEEAKAQNSAKSFSSIAASERIDGGDIDSINQSEALEEEKEEGVPDN